MWAGLKKTRNFAPPQPTGPHPPLPHLSCALWPGLVGPPGFHTTTREPKRAHLSAPVFKNHHQNSTRRHPEREEKKEISGGRENKKSEILGGPGEGRSRGRAVQEKGGPGEGRSRRGGSGERGPEILNTTGTNRHQQAPTGTNRHQQAPTGTGTNRHQQAPTGTNRHQQAATGTNRQQQAPTGSNRHQQATTENLAKTLKHQNWPNAVWPNAVNTLKH